MIYSFAGEAQNYNNYIIENNNLLENVNEKMNKAINLSIPLIPIILIAWGITSYIVAFFEAYPAITNILDSLDCPPPSNSNCPIR